MEYAISQLSNLPQTKEQQARFVENAKAEILDGVFDARELLFRKKMVLDTLEKIFDDEKVQRHLQDEIEKYGKTGATWDGAKIEIGHKSEWDYSKCNDTEVTDLLAQKAELDKKLKARQKFLQNLQKPVADPETGEVIYPAARETSDYFKVTLAK